MLPGLATAVIFGSNSPSTRDLVLYSFETGFPFFSLLQFAGLLWRYSYPLTEVTFEFSLAELNFQPSVSRPFRFDIGISCGAHNQILNFLQSDNYVLLIKSGPSDEKTGL
jgi:hypothetical protein